MEKNTKNWIASIATGIGLGAALYAGEVAGTMQGKEYYAMHSQSTPRHSRAYSGIREKCQTDIVAALSEASEPERKDAMQKAKRKYDDGLFFSVLKNYPVVDRNTGETITLNDLMKESVSDYAPEGAAFTEDPMGTSYDIAIDMVTSSLLGEDYDVVGALLGTVDPNRPRTPEAAEKRKSPGIKVYHTGDMGTVAIDKKGKPLLNPKFDKHGRLMQHSEYFNSQDQRRAEHYVRNAISKPYKLSNYVRDVGRAIRAKNEDDNTVRRRTVGFKKNRTGGTTETVIMGTRTSADRARRARSQQRSEVHGQKARGSFNAQAKNLQRGFGIWAGNAQKQTVRGTRHAQQEAQRRAEEASKDAQQSWKDFENDVIIPFQKAVGYRK